MPAMAMDQEPKAYRESCPQCDWVGRWQTSPWRAMNEAAAHYEATGHQRKPSTAGSPEGS